MSVLIQDGFDVYGTDQDKLLQAGWYSPSTQFVPLPTSGRFGGGALRLQWNGSDGQYDHGKAGVTTFYFFNVFYNDPGNESLSGTQAWQFRNLADNAHCRLHLNGSLQITAYDATGALVGTGPAVHALKTWHHLQAKIVLHGSAGTIEVWVDGVQELNLSGLDTLHVSGTATFERLWIGNLWHGNRPDYRDDIMCWDESGSGMTGWTDGKDLRIDTVRPNADTAQEDFVPLSAGDQYVEVDDSPNHDGDASYNGSVNAGDKDRLGLTTISGVPVEIYNVRTRVWGKKTNAGAANVKVGIYSGATEGMSAAQGLSTDYDHHGHNEEINPDDSLPWEVADIDALQVQYESA